MRSVLTPRNRLLLLVLAISTIVAVACAKYNASGQLQMGVAATHVMIDYPEPSIVDRRALGQDISTLEKRAELYGRLMTTTPVLEAIARRMGIPGGQISGVARTTAAVPIPLTQPDSEVRASQIVDSSKPYRLELQSDPQEPILSIYTAAPSAEDAQRLADNAILGLQDFLKSFARKQAFPESELPRLRQLGEAHGSAAGGKAKIVIAVLTFVVTFSLTAAVLWLLVLLLRRRRGPAPARPARPRFRDDWPHTNRLLPWSLAAFITMLWLTPFDKVQLSIHTPIDMKLDRMTLPFVFLIWLLAFGAGERARPRLRPTLIHLAVGIFVAVAFLSVTLDARYLNQTLELMLSLKKLPLLLSYVSVFLILSTSIRPTEVRAFMSLILGLAVIVGLGIIWEYRFNTNVFSFVIQKVLPGPFVLNGDDTPGGGVDSLGRRGIVGPTAVGVEAVSVLALALPIVVVRLLSAHRRKERVLYGVAACILIAATFATGRKSGLLAPIAVILTLAYFRRRELLTLAPVGLVIAIVVTALSPGAVHGIISQFFRADSSSVATTSDRTADYDAVRPDVWTHLLFGRGFGSYNHDSYRILDSEILSRTIETGVLGLLAFLFVGVSVVLATRSTIARRESPYAPIALIGAASAVCFITVSTLFDVLGFPHATYIFLTMAGLVSVVVGKGVDPPPRPSREHAARVRRRTDAERASPRRRDALV